MVQPPALATTNDDSIKNSNDLMIMQKWLI
jgi:hypothetical protein